jgi:hypothetical protein
VEAANGLLFVVALLFFFVCMVLVWMRKNYYPLKARSLFNTIGGMIVVLYHASTLFFVVCKLNVFYKNI